MKQDPNRESSFIELRFIQVVVYKNINHEDITHDLSNSIFISSFYYYNKTNKCAYICDYLSYESLYKI